MDNIEKIKDELKNNLSLFRYEHSCLVAESAKSLARDYQLNGDKAYITGLIHDIAKEYSDIENDYYIKKYPISKELLDIDYKPVLHAEIGALVAKEKYDLDDEVCQAIRYHALGNINMTLFDKVIFIADKFGRKQLTPSLENIKSLAYQDIDEAIIFYLQEKKEKLEKKNQCFLEESLLLLDYLCKYK